MKRLKSRALSLLLTLAMLVGMLPTTALATDSELDNLVYKNNLDTYIMPLAGDEPIEISTAEDLKQLASAAEGSQFVLAADITLPADWEPIEFAGVLNGNGYTITLTGNPVFKNLNSGSIISNLILAGAVTSGSTHISSLTSNNCGGTVRNCISYTDVTYTGSAGGLMPRFVGGLVAQFSSTGGVMNNCVYAGTLTQGNADAWGSLANAAYGANPTITVCIGVGVDRIGSSEGMSDCTEIAAGNNTLILNTSDFNPADYVEQLNSNRDIAAGDLEWEVVGDKLTLKRAVDEFLEATEAEVAALQAAVAQAVDTSKVYTADSWAAYAEALSKAQGILQQETLKQDVVVNATDKLNAAFNGLTERILAVVDLSGEEVIPITSVSGLEYMQAGKYYRLDADLEIKSTDYYFPAEMNAVFDGNGHTITLSNKNYVWKSLGPNAVVQNLGVKGGVASANNAGAIAGASQGLIINCWSLANVTTNGQNGNLKHTGGLVGQLQSGGAIVNSWVAGNVVGKGVNTANGSVGALVGSTESNSLLQSCYYQTGSASQIVGMEGVQITDCAEKARKDFYSQAFIDLLNANRGGGREWTLAAEGYPHLGEAQEYIPPEDMKITFNYLKEGKQPVEFKTSDGFEVSLQDAVAVGNDRNKVGTFSMPGAARWQDTIVGNKDFLLVNEDGALSIYKPGSAEVVAISSEADGSKELARFTVTVVEGEAVDEFRLAIDGQPVGNPLTLQGSEHKTLTPQIKLAGAAAWQDIAVSQVEFSHTGNLHRVNNSIYAEEPGEMTLTAKYQDKEITINIVSEFVAVTSIKPAPAGEYYIHQRNPNGQPLGEFLDLTLSHKAGTVIVEPENASYRDKWQMASSDDTIVECKNSMIIAALPKKAGTVTLTAVVEANGAQPRVEGTSQVTIKYENPVQTVSIAETRLTVKENEEIPLPITFNGPKSADGLRVTEPAMDWNFSGEGLVRIETDGSPIIWEEKPDGTKPCEANDEFKLIGVKAGEVKVVGTPQDKTGNAKPVEFTVTVTPGEVLPDADNNSLAQVGIASGAAYLTANAPVEYRYGNEWEIFALRRSGQTIDPARLEAYLDSVAAAYQNNPGATETKPTTIARVALTLSVLGENAADFRGLNFIDMLCNSERIGEGGNEPMWALLALDSRDYTEPADAVWTRDKLVTELILQYQNPEGGFGLTDNLTASVDMTAMAVQALAPYYTGRADVKEAVDKALVYLQSQMSADCGFNSNVEATAQVVLALAALNRSPVLPENGFAPNLSVNMLTNITSFAAEGGGYKHYAADRAPQIMSTTQAMLAFEAYRRQANAENFIYDLSDVNRLAMLQQRLAEIEHLQAADYTAESWQALQTAKNAAQKLLAGTYTEADLQAADKALAAAIAGLQLLNPDTKPSPSPDAKTITVSFRLIGDNKHEGADTHEKYINWIKTMNITVPDGSTVYDVFVEALSQKGLNFEEGQYSYISSIQAPAVLGGFWLAEFDNGSSSGWKYLVNGRYPNVGLRYYWPKNGDVIIWRYVDDYTDNKDNSNKWQEAEDIDPNPGMSGGSGGLTGVSGEKTSIVAPEANIDAKGVATAEISIKDVVEALSKAKKDKAESITIMPQNTGKAKEITVSLKVDSAKDIAAAEIGLNVNTSKGSLAIPHPALQSIAKQAGGVDIRINVSEQDTKKEEVNAKVNNALQQAAAIFRGAMETLFANACVTNVTITSNGKEINTFDGHQLTINLPVDSKHFAKDESYKVVVLSSDSTVETLIGKCLRVNGELVVQVKVSHLSTFIVTTEKEKAEIAKVTMNFADVNESQWFYEAVKFVYEAGLMNGEGENTFNPNGNLNRAMLVTILYRLESLPEITEASKFTDVAAGQWYSEAVIWASENGIVKGYEDNTFKPMNNVSREEMAAMLMRYAEFKQIDVSATKDISGYQDAAKVSSWAQQNMSWANSAGLIQGDEHNNLNPKGNATRAEAAMILMRLVKNVIS